MEFSLILGVPPSGGGGGWMLVRGCPLYTCTCMHTHTCTCMYDIIGNPRDFPKSNGGGHLHEIIMFTTHACVCVCVCVRACAHVCGTSPNHPPPISTQPPPRRATGSPKHQNSITLELIEIIRFCLKILYL